MATDKKSYGPVQDGKITHLAVTGVAQFNHDEEGCQLRWHYKNVEGRPEPEKTWHTKGTEVDNQINHYLHENQNVLGKIARAGIHILPAPGPDLLVQWGLNNKLRPKKPDGRWANFFPPQESLLWAAGVPFVGFPDVINAREEYLVPTDDTAYQKVELKKEPGVVEVLDNKTTSDFKWAKPSDKLITATQMNGYGLFVLEVDSAVINVRLSHNIYRTDDRKAPAAIKRSALVSAKEIRDRWTQVVEPIVERMKSVAGTKRSEDVEGNLSACESFSGCPHKDYCHMQEKLKQLNPITRMKMASLLKNRPAAGAAVAGAAPNGAAATTTPWIPPAPPAPPAPPTAAALPIMQQPTAPPPPQAAPPLSPASQAAPPPQAAPAQPQAIAASTAVQNERYWVSGVLMQYLCSTSGKQAFLPIVDGQMQGTPVHIAYEAGIYPEHAFATLAQAAPPPAPAPAAPLPPTAPPVQAQAASPLAPLPAPAPAAPAASTRGRKKGAAAAPAAAAADGFVLFVNAVPNRQFTDLSGYVSDAVEQIREQFGVPDIRVAPDDSPLAFGKYKGVLAGVVRAEPPPPGTYVAFTKGSEFTEVVVEALWPFAGPGSAKAF